MSIRAQEILIRLTGADQGKEDRIAQELDEAVHESFSEQASAINNQGAVAQIDYLLESGMSEEQILEWAI